MAFLYSAEGASRKADRGYGDRTGFELYGLNDYDGFEYGFEEEDSDWED